MKNIIILFLVLYSTNIIFAQFYIQPQGGAIWNKSKIDKTTPYIINFYDSQPYFGLSIGKKINKIEHSLGYTYYSIGINYSLRNLPYWGYGWGTKHMDTHNISYDFNYNTLHWKRLDVKTGISLHLCTSILTWSAKTSGKIDSGYDTLKIIGKYDVIGYERTQLLLEPHIDIDIRLSKRISWTTHWGHIFGNKNIYTLVSNYTIKGVPQPTGSTRVDGTAKVVTTGFKFYFKQKKNSE